MMRTDRQKKILAISGGAAALVLIGAWIWASSVATSRAEDKLYAFLDQYRIRDVVHWQNLSASPFGSATLKSVTLTVGKGKDSAQMTADRMIISGFEDSADRKAARIEVTGISGEDGFSPLAHVGLMQAAGRADLPPFSMKLAWDLDERADQGTLQFSLEQPEAFASDLGLKMMRLRDLLHWIDRLEGSKGDEAREMFGRFGFFGPLGALTAAGSKMPQLEINSITASIKDDGYVKRSRTLVARHGFGPVPGQGSAETQRSKWLRETIGKSKRECKRKPETVFDGVPIGSEDCLAVMSFVAGDKSTLALTMAPARPVSLQQLFAAMQRRGLEGAVRLLEMKLDN